MKKFFSYIIMTLAALFAFPAQGMAEKANKVLAGDAVTVTGHSLYLTDDDRVYVNLEILLGKEFKLASNRMTHLVPLFHAADTSRTYDFAPVVVYGRRREIIHERTGLVPTDAYRILRRKQGEEQRIEYTALIPYEEWMQEGRLELWVDLCGCANCRKEEQYIPVGRLLPPFDPTKFVTFATPQTTGPKVFSLSGEAYIDFKLDKIDLEPNYRRNPQELRRIYASIDSVRGGDNRGITRIDSIHIKGYASPEGRYSRNVWLAANRARTLTDYVRSEYSLEEVHFGVTSEPEDWAGLRRRVAEGDWEEKERILAIIDDPAITDPDVRNNTLARLPVYKQLLAEVYPALRHSDYTIFYTVRGFNDDEVVEIYRTRPWMLDQNELYRVSLTMQPGTDEYNALFLQAVSRFPADTTANLNAAAVALQQHNVKLAERYLPKAGNSPAAQCNRAVALWLKGEKAVARRLFEQAALAGSPEARQAVEELRRMNNEIIKE